MLAHSQTISTWQKQWEIWEYVKEKRRFTIAELTEKFHITHEAALKILGSLKEQGLIKDIKIHAQP